MLKEHSVFIVKSLIFSPNQLSIVSVLQSRIYPLTGILQICISHHNLLNTNTHYYKYIYFALDIFCYCRPDRARCARVTVLVPCYFFFLYHRMSMPVVSCYLILMTPIVLLGELKEVKDKEGN